MSGLDRSIAEWRRLMSVQSTCAKADAAELEDHLREEITGLQQVGLSEDEAFLVASRRLGTPASLGKEFAKVNPSVLWGHRLGVAAIVLLCYFLGTFLFSFCSKASALLSLRLGMSGYEAGISGVVIATLFVGGLAYVLVRRYGEKRITCSATAGTGKGKSRIIILAAFLFGCLLLPVMPFLMTVVLTRFASISQTGEIFYVESAALGGLRLLLPFCLATWIVFRSRPSASGLAQK